MILWAFIAVVTALLFGGVRESSGGSRRSWRRWSRRLAAAPAAIDNKLPPGLVIAFFVLNIVAVCSTAYVVLRSFVTDGASSVSSRWPT